MRRPLLILLMLLVAGCSASPALRPVEAQQHVLAHPEIAPWFAAHSAPGVLGGLTGLQAKRLRTYRPGITVDRVKEGLLVRLESSQGPEPRSVTVLLDGETGSVLSIKKE